MHTMPRGKLRPTLAEVKALLAEDGDFLRPLVQAVLQELRSDHRVAHVVQVVSIQPSER
jgi:hypothetical protein